MDIRYCQNSNLITSAIHYYREDLILDMMNRPNSSNLVLPTSSTTPLRTFTSPLRTLPQHDTSPFLNHSGQQPSPLLSRPHRTSPYVNVPEHRSSPYVNLRLRDHGSSRPDSHYVNLRLKNPAAGHHTYVNVTGLLTPPPSPQTTSPDSTLCPISLPHTCSSGSTSSSSYHSSTSHHSTSWNHSRLTPPTCPVPVATSTHQEPDHQDPTYLTLNYPTLPVLHPHHRIIPDHLLPSLEYEDNLILPAGDEGDVPTLFTVPHTTCYTPLLRITRKLFRRLKRKNKKKSARVETYFKDNFVFTKL